MIYKILFAYICPNPNPNRVIPEEINKWVAGHILQFLLNFHQ